jgi:hypothetical protein
VTTVTLADCAILGDWVERLDTRAAGRRNACAVDVGGRGDSVGCVQNERVNLDNKARAGPACR